MTTEEVPGALGVVLVGLPAATGAALERFAARGFEVLSVDVADATDIEGTLENVAWAMNALTAHLTYGKIAVVGYGFGGRYAYLALTRLGADAAAGFCGTGIGEHLAEAPLAKKPLSLHFGDDDERVPFAEVRAIKGALEGFATTEIYRYPVYDDAAAHQAEGRVFAFLDAVRAAP